MKKKYNPMLRQEARIAAEQGLKRFIPTVNNRCESHGSDANEHYTASGRCCECTKLAKKPSVQAEYWKTVKTCINARKRKEYAEKKAREAFWYVGAISKDYIGV